MKPARSGCMGTGAFDALLFGKPILPDKAEYTGALEIRDEGRGVA
jgi:hypothetical protein